MKFHILATLLAIQSSAHASRVLKEGNHHHGGGHGGSHRGGGPPGGNRPFGGGRDFPKPDTITIACEPEYPCALRDGTDGTFVCRTMTHPIYGTESSKAICIPNDKAWESDECGCCGEECVQPDYVDLTCDADTQPDAFPLSTAIARSSGGRALYGGKGGPGGKRHSNLVLGVNATVVCRDATNPFTGEPTEISLLVPDNLGLEGDDCGCCNDICPIQGEKQFERPEFVNKTCAAEGDDFVTCTPKRRRGGGNNNNNNMGGMDDTDLEPEGFFVCRSLYDPNTGEEKEEALCITEDKAWETDECGCCGGDCPEDPRATELDCDAATTETCTLRGGEEGIFVCRALFHPVDGQVRERTMCIPGDNGWVTDTCGCCDSGCPDAPTAEGFPDENSQLELLALEDPFSIDAVSVLEDDGEDSGATSAMMMNMGVGMMMSAVMAISMSLL